MKPEKDVRLSSPPRLSKPNGYSHLAEVGGGKLVYIAGQVAFDRDGELVGRDDFPAQVGQVFANLNEAVQSAGGSFTDIVKLNYYCVDRVGRDQLPHLREIRDHFVNTAAPPASTFVFVRDLVNPAWLIEIEAVAVVGGAA